MNTLQLSYMKRGLENKNQYSQINHLLYPNIISEHAKEDNKRTTHLKVGILILNMKTKWILMSMFYLTM